MDRIGEEGEEIDFQQFCILLDAGGENNPSRISVLLSGGKGMSKALSFFTHLQNDYH